MPSIQWDHPRVTSQLFGHPMTWLAITLVIVLVSYIWMNPDTPQNPTESAGMLSSENSVDSPTQTVSTIKQETMTITRDSDAPRARKFLITESQENRIDPLFASAVKNYNQGKYLYPEDQNAWSDYQQILEIDPQNNRAKSGLLAIKNLFIDNVQTAIEAGDFESAEHWLVQLDTIQPGDPFQANTRNRIKTQAKIIQTDP